MNVNQQLTGTSGLEKCNNYVKYTGLGSIIGNKKRYGPLITICNYIRNQFFTWKEMYKDAIREYRNIFYSNLKHLKEKAMKIIFMFEWGSGNSGWNETYKREIWLKYCKSITIRTLFMRALHEYSISPTHSLPNLTNTCN